MTFTIFKYGIYEHINLQDSQNSKFFVEMPKGAHILAVQTQGSGFDEQPCIWAYVNDDLDKEKRYFEIVGTGWSAPDPDNFERYIGTYQTGAFVFHLFEI